MVSDKVNRRILERVEEISSSRPFDETDKSNITREFNIPVSQVETVSSFYSGKTYKDKACTGLSCYLKREGKAISRSLEKVSCLGYCDHGPVVQKAGKYFHVGESGLEEIEESTEDYVNDNVEDIATYITRGGYTALEELISSDDTSYILRKLEESDLRGMGGAGFPAHLKWKSFRNGNRDVTYLLVNAHEGEPGTFKDRKIMELFPHTVIEGALITALSNSIKEIFIGLKEEYRLAYKSLSRAVGELGIKFGKGRVSGILPNIQIIRLGGSYVTGEETALMEAIEDRRSEPRLRPPFPTEKGLYGKPTLIHNVETVSLIPELLRNGTEKMQKMYCISGDVRKPGTASVPPGITAEELVSRYAESEPDTIKAFLPGGLSGGFLTSSQIGTRLDSESVRKAGASLGTGAFIALSGNRCMVDITYEISSFFQYESCGKCAPCRLGTVEIKKTLERLKKGKATKGDLESSSRTAQAMIDGSICALGQVAGRIYLDSVKLFDDEFRDHIRGICQTGTCRIGDRP